jgi:hypothetical protein
VFRTIKFDDEFGCEANKVDDVAADRGLTAEFVATEFFCAEKVPESFFSWCGFVAKRAGEVVLRFVSVHVRWFTPSLALPARGREPDDVIIGRARPRTSRQSLVIKKRARIAWVSDLAVHNGRERWKFVGFGVVWADDVEDLPCLSDELVGDEAAVAAPREGFGAHDGGA